MKYVASGLSALVVDDRGPGVTGDSRWRAYLKGRTMGGYLNGFGSTWEESVDELEERYEHELASIRAARIELAKTLKPSRRKR